MSQDVTKAALFIIYYIYIDTYEYNLSFLTKLFRITCQELNVPSNTAIWMS